MKLIKEKTNFQVKLWCSSEFKNFDVFYNLIKKKKKKKKLSSKENEFAPTFFIFNLISVLENEKMQSSNYTYRWLLQPFSRHWLSMTRRQLGGRMLTTKIQTEAEEQPRH